MKLDIDRLSSHLSKSLAPVYVVSGDEPLLVQEAGDAIREAARAGGCTERSVWDVGNGFDWDAWLQASMNQSLFAERQLIELRMPSAKPGDAGGKAIKAYCEHIDGSNVLLVTTAKLEKSTPNTRWFKGLEAAGVWVPVWPLERNRLPAWVERRMQARRMRAPQDAVQLLVDRVEGNPLACVQEIEKLYLLHGSGELTLEDVEDAVVDSARFDVFALADAALAGDAARSARVLWRLREEGVQLPVLLWALTRELRQVAQLAAALAAGTPRAAAYQAARVWDKRKPLYNRALSRYDAAGWRRLLADAASIDPIIKGCETGNPWDELLKLSVRAAGVATTSQARSAIGSK